MSKLWEIKGKTFMITGGASGLGARYAEAFLKEGAKRIVILDIADEVGKSTAARLNISYPNGVEFIKIDVSDEKNITYAFNETITKFNKLDVIINNAGIMSDAPDLWKKACDVNWESLVSLTMKGVEHMRKDKGGAGGTIVNISSTAALYIWPFLPIYSGSKMAVLHFSNCLACEPFYEQSGVRILTICFGPTATSLMDSLDKRTYDSNLGIAFDAHYKEHGKSQKVNSAVKALVEMFRNGCNGSIWASVEDKPVKDITQTIQNAFGEIKNILES